MYKSLSKINDIRIYFLLFSFPKLLERPNYFNVPSLYFRAFLEGNPNTILTQIVWSSTLPVPKLTMALRNSQCD